MAAASPKKDTNKKSGGSSSAKASADTSQVNLRVFETGKMEKVNLPAHFALPASPALIAQVVHVQNKRLRVRRAHTKDRSEVRGGGKKPWAQKGTGRARASSIRSPLWVGGGITFGPRSHKTRVLPSSVKERQGALRGAIASHLQAATFELVRFPKEMSGKTRDFVKSIQEPMGLLLIVADGQKLAVRAGRNVPGLRVIPISHVVVSDILKARRVWVDEQAILALQARSGVNIAK